jgi:hypothetical protein
MSPEFKDWIDVSAKLFAGAGVFIAALNYRKQVRIKRGEWLKSLFEKFYENQLYKDVRDWVDNNELEQKIKGNNVAEVRINQEKFTDFLNFFEFIGILYYRKELKLEQVNELFDYYLKKIKTDASCNEWIDAYGFEKLRNLLNKIK